VVAYNVSGEYAMIKAAASYGWIDEKKNDFRTYHQYKMGWKRFDFNLLC